MRLLFLVEHATHRLALGAPPKTGHGRVQNWHMQMQVEVKGSRAHGGCCSCLVAGEKTRRGLYAGFADATQSTEVPPGAVASATTLQKTYTCGEHTSRHTGVALCGRRMAKYKHLYIITQTVCALPPHLRTPTQDTFYSVNKHGCRCIIAACKLVYMRQPADTTSKIHFTHEQATEGTKAVCQSIIAKFSMPMQKHWWPPLAAVSFFWWRADRRAMKAGNKPKPKNCLPLACAVPAVRVRQKGKTQAGASMYSHICLLSAVDTRQGGKAPAVTAARTRHIQQ